MEQIASRVNTVSCQVEDDPYLDEPIVIAVSTEVIEFRKISDLNITVQHPPA